MSKNTLLSELINYISANSSGNVVIAAPTSGFALDVTGTGRFTGALTLGSTITNGTFTYTLPSATGTLALTSSLGSYLPLSGGTLTGALNGTSATFSGAFEAGRTGGSVTAGDLSVDPTSLSANVYVGRLSSTSNDNTNFIVRNRIGGELFKVIGNTGAATFTGGLTVNNNSSSSPFELNNTLTSNYLFINSPVALEAMTRYYNPTAGNWYTGIRASAGIGTTASYHIFSSTYGADVLALNTNGTASFAGNVGIGTTAPTSILDIKAADPNLSINQTTQSNNSGIRFKTNDNEIGKITAQGANGNMDINMGVSSGWGGYITFRTDTSERMRITSGGNVGIGTTSPSGRLTVNTGTNENVSILSAGGGDMRISALNDAASANVQLSIQGSPLLFRVSGGVEAMRITSAGFVLIGSTAADPVSSNVAGISFEGSLGSGKFSRLNNACLDVNRVGGTDGEVVRMYKTGTQVGNISVTSSSTSYNTSSDYRLKEDLKSINGLEIVNKIKVYDYKWKAEDSRMDGVLAHELAEVLPYAVQGVKDGEQMQSVDYSKIVPVMVQAIKDLKSEIETLKNK